MSNDTSEVILENLRFWFQKVFVPIMVCIGMTGNTITVMVLTRKRMRSSTNIYLSALAIADIMYLFFVLLLSFQHYNNIHDRKYELYWRFYGLSHWLCDAASSTSVWLTVSFTIERYIAVSHPLRGRFFCTESRAKTITVIVYIFCILTTASTTFEHQLTLNDTVVCSKCQNNHGNHSNNNLSSAMESGSSLGVFNDPKFADTLKDILVNCTSNHSHIKYVYPQKTNGTKERSVPDNAKAKNLSNMIVHQMVPTENETELILNQTDTIKSCCITKLYIDVEATILGKNEYYNTFINWYSALVWGIIPFILIATFNSFLITAVYKSQKRRNTMTRTNTLTAQTENASLSHENRITIMLIAIVVMFLLCQTPTASFLIYIDFYPHPTTRQRILGNVFNWLVTLNASCNFLLYSIMSKKFRSTFKQLFFERNKKRQDTIQLSSLRSTGSQKFNPYRHGLSRNASDYHTPRNLEATSLTSLPRTKSLIIRPLGKARSTDLVV